MATHFRIILLEFFNMKADVKPEQKRPRGRPPKPEAEGSKTESFYADAECVALLRTACEKTNRSKGDVLCEALREWAKKRKIDP